MSGEAFRRKNDRKNKSANRDSSGAPVVAAGDGVGAKTFAFKTGDEVKIKQSARSMFAGAVGSISSCTSRGYRIIFDHPCGGSTLAILFQEEELEPKREKP
jgi:hypothetical protein